MVRLLVIEESASDAALLRNLVRRQLPDAEVEIAVSLSSGLARMTDHEVDGILLDLDLPDSRGLATVQRACETVPKVAVVVVTGTDDEELAAASLDAGAMDYLVKGRFDAELLGRAIRYALERKKAINAVLDSENRYRQIVETAQEGIWTGDLRRITTFVNQRLLDFLGYEHDEMIGRPLRDFLQPDAASRALQILNTASPLHVDVPLRRKGGETLWGLAGIAPLRDQHGVTTGTLAMITDITDRRREERARRSSERLFRALVEHTFVGVFITSGERLLYSNPAHRRIFGHEEQELSTMPVSDLFAPDERERLVEMMRDRLAGKPVAEHYFTRGLCRDGREIDLEVHATRAIYRKQPAVIGTVIDVTERRRALETQAYLASIVSTSDDAIIGLDREGRVQSWNPAAEAIYGYAAAEASGRPFAEVVGIPQQEFQTAVAMVRNGRRYANHEVRHRHRDGTTVEVAVTLSPIVTRGEVTGTSIIARDITRRKLIGSQAEQASRLSSLGTVAARMAHEFNNVLMGILPFVEVIGRGAADPAMKKAVVHIQNSVQRGRSITNEILRFTRPVEPSIRSFDLGAWLASLQDEFAPMLRPSRVEVRVQEGLFVAADSAQLEQVLINLALNAHHAMPEGGTFTLEARRVAHDTRFTFAVVPAPERFIHLLVRDTGGGIPPEVLPRIFEPLFTTKKTTGTGLGLTIAHQVIVRQGGRIFAESRVGEGTTFHILLPAAAEEADTEHAETMIPPRFGELRLLLVEDESSVAEGLIQLLQLEGMETHHVRTGGRAAEAIETFRPDVVVLDVGLPDIAGTEVYAKIATRWPALPVLISSGHAGSSVPGLNGLPPHVSFLQKPYDAGALLAAIQRVLGRAV